MINAEYMNVDLGLGTPTPRYKYYSRNFKCKLVVSFVLFFFPLDCFFFFFLLGFTALPSTSSFKSVKSGIFIVW